MKNYIDTNLDLLKRIQVPIVKRGIYFLYNSEEIVYIGKSENIHGRIYKEHLTDHDKKGKIFDAFKYIEVDKEDDLDKIECLFILEYQPKYNIKSLGNGRYSSNMFKDRSSVRKELAYD